MASTVVVAPSMKDAVALRDLGIEDRFRTLNLQLGDINDRIMKATTQLGLPLEMSEIDECTPPLLLDSDDLAVKTAVFGLRLARLQTLQRKASVIYQELFEAQLARPTNATSVDPIPTARPLQALADEDDFTSMSPAPRTGPTPPAQQAVQRVMLLAEDGHNCQRDIRAHCMMPYCLWGFETCAQPQFDTFHWILIWIGGNCPMHNLF